MNPQKPKHIKEAQGTLRKSREIAAPAVGEALSVLPAVPDGMGVDEEKYFLYACGELLELGLLTSQFIVSIEMAAIWYAEFIEARKRCREGEGQYVAQSGFSQISGWFTQMEKAYKQVVDFEGRYGLNLVSSQRISMPPRDKGSEYFD